jgi:hypothetical protein
MSDAYAYWRAKLAGKGFVYLDEPHAGFYRRRPFRGSPWQAVALFERDGELVCLVWDRERPPHHVWSPFLEAITEQEYRAACAVRRFSDDYETHAYARSAGPLTTELRDAKAVLPIIRGAHGTCNTRE